MLRPGIRTANNLPHSLLKSRQPYQAGWQWSYDPAPGSGIIELNPESGEIRMGDMIDLEAFRNWKPATS